MMRVVIVTTSCVLISLTNCADINSKFLESKIVGGRNVKYNTFKYVVLLRKYGEHFCGGCLISAEHVLTAAHCFISKAGKKSTSLVDYSALIGTRSRLKGGTVHEFKFIHIEPHYDPDESFIINDVAVVTLKKKVQLTKKVSIIPLSKSNPKSGIAAFITGWGSTHTLRGDENFTSAIKLKALKVITIDNKNCESLLDYPVQRTQICAVAGNTAENISSSLSNTELNTMSVPGPRFVNNQFNSPIKLYSPASIQETLERQTQILSNGAIGIDFNQLAKPANLQNSAVLRMLEEEENRKRTGKPNLKRVAWPPPPEDQNIDEYIEQGPIQSKTRGIGEYASYQSSPSPQNFVPSSPSPVSPGGTLRQPSQFQPQKSVKGWAPVTHPATSPLPQTPLQAPTWGQPQQQTAVLQTQSSLDRTRQQPHSTPTSTFEAPPSTITLRSEAPISQAPAPVYLAQPAATKAPISGNMRGDQKWPPASVKAQAEEENRARLELAKGPVCRPRRVNKDYRGFFAQHALTTTYPGYRAPPGTQYFTPAYQN